MKCGTVNNKNNIHDMSIFAGKTLMITGGTGSFGNAVLNRFYVLTSAKSAFFRAMRRNRMICAMSIR